VRHHRDMQVWPGDAYPLGATYDGTGTNFALFSEVAQRVVLCLYPNSLRLLMRRGGHRNGW
jgi:isoamylase